LAFSLAPAHTGHISSLLPTSRPVDSFAKGIAAVRFFKYVRRKSRSLADLFRRRRHQFFEPLEARHMLASDWQNPYLPADVSGEDGQPLVTPIDALLVINEINAPRLSGPGGVLPELSGSIVPPPYLDPSGDGVISALDALFVINYLSEQNDHENSAGDLLDLLTPQSVSSTTTLTTASNQPFTPTNELLLNTPSNRGQEAPAIALVPGGSVVVWSSMKQDGSDWGVYGQRLDANGQKIGPEFRVNQTTNKAQRAPRIDSFSDGRFVVTWEGLSQKGDPGWGVYARLFNADGSPAGNEFRVNEITTGTQRAPSVAVQSDGTFAIAWEGRGTVTKALKEEYEIFVRKFSSTGAPLTSHRRVNNATKGLQENPVITAAPGGGFALTWNGNGTGDAAGVYLRRLDANTAPLGTEVLVNKSFTKGDQRQAVLDFAPDGRLIVAWASTNRQNGWGVYAQQFTASGAFLGSEVLVNQYLTGTQWRPAIGTLGDGTFIVSWEGKTQGDVYGVSYRQFSATGVGLTNEQLLNQTNIGVQRNSALGVGQTSFIVAWDGNGPNDCDGIFARGAASGGPAVNQPPVHTVPGQQSLNEDSALAFSTASSNRISISDPDVASDELAVTLAVSQGTLTLTNRTGLSFTTGTGQSNATMSFTGTLTNINAALNTLFYFPPENYNGPASLTITTSDQGHNGEGGAQSDTDTVALNVLSVNDVPAFTKGADQTVNSTVGAQSVPNWATNMSVGPANESSQTLAFLVSATNPALFSVQPAISPAGTLTFTPVSGASGSTNVSVRVQDNGGTLRNGVDTSPVQTFTINLSAGGQIDSSPFTLVEGTNFNVDANRPFVIPGQPSILQIFYDAPVFDTQSQGRVRDAFEAALVDENGQTLVHTIASSRDAFFNQTESLTTQAGVNTQLASGQIQLDLSHIPAGTEATLVVRLVNNDADTTTSVRITNLRVISGSLNSPVGATPAAALASQALTGDALTNLQNITSDFGLVHGRTSLHEDNGVLFTDVALKNNGNATIGGPLVLVIENISDPTVALANPDGKLSDGRPYLNYTSQLPGGTLTPTESTNSRTIQFLNPQGLRFTFGFSVLTASNTAPTLATIPTQEALVGQQFRYVPQATDPDGNELEYSLLAFPPNMTIDDETGEIVWTPTANDLGTHQVIVRIADGAGGSEEEKFTLVVRQNVPNRPPVITSRPETDAAVSVSFEITDIPVGRGPVGLAVGNLTGTGNSVLTANEITQTISLAEYLRDGSFAAATSTQLGSPPPRTDQLFEQGYNVDVGMIFTRSEDVQGLTSADFNGDGIVDLATTIHAHGAFIEDNAVTLMLGRGDGTYDDPRVIYRNTLPQDTNRLLGVLARDFDGDDKLDLVVAEAGTNNSGRHLLFFKGNADATFDAPVSSVNFAYRPHYIRASDFDDDGDLDIVMAGELNGGWQVEATLNNGDGTFGTPVAYNASPGRYIPDLQLADLDGQNGEDLIIADWNGQIEVRLNDGLGVFGTPLFQTLTTSEGCCSSGHGGAAALTIGDFDGDSKLDVHTGASGGASLTFKGNGNGTFVSIPSSSPLVQETGFPQNSAYADSGGKAIDLNRDGKLDVYYANRFSNILQIGYGRGDGIFDFDFIYAQPASDDPTIRPEGSGFASSLAIDANNDGVYDIATASFAISGGRPGRLAVILGDKPGSFRTPTLLSQNLATNILTDVNNDGAPDILGVNAPLAYALNNADGTFQDYQRSTGGLGNEFYLNYAVTTDFDADGKQDIFYAGTNGVQGGHPPRLLISLGVGDGTFTQPTEFGRGTGANQLGAADLTGDNRPEAINITNGGLGKVIQIWRNNGTGTGFTLIPDSTQLLTYPTTGGGFSTHFSGFALEDFDGDGITDLIAHQTAGTNNSPAEKFMFFKGRTAANPTDVSQLFDAPLITAPGMIEVKKMISADLNNDGDLDLVLNSQFFSYTMLGNGDGTFGPAQRINHGVDDVTVGDFNGDGTPDLGFTNSFYAPTFLLGKGDGTFGLAKYYTPAFGSQSMLDAADVDGDGIDDVVHRSGNDSGSPRASNIYLSRRPGVQAVAVGDINGDGKQDAIAADYGSGHLTPLLGDGAGGLDRQFDLIVGRGPVAVTTFDLDNDTDQDIISVNRAANTISILNNDGTGVFTRTDLLTGQRPAAVSIRNLNDDNLPDLVVANSDETSISYFRNLGNGQFAAGVEIAIGLKPDSVATGDVNGDGRADIIAGSTTADAFVTLLNQGTNTFLPEIPIPAGASVGGLALGDLTGDGRPDLIVTNPLERRVTLYTGLGAAKFTRPQPISFDHEPTDVTLADMNGDGALDIVTANADSDTTTVIVSRFDPAQKYEYQVTTTDPDGDAVTLELTTAPAGMSISPTGQITWFAAPDQVGTHPVTVRATDGRGGSTTQSYLVEVRSQFGNDDPIFVTQPITTTTSTTNYEYSARAADSDQDPLRYELVEAPEGMAIDANTGDISWGESIGRGLTFNGIDDMLVVGSTPSLQITTQSSYAVWVKFDKTPVETGKHAFLVGSTTEQRQVKLIAREWLGEPRFVMDVFGRNAVSSTIIQRDTWYHVAATYTFEGATQLYINGVLEGGNSSVGLPGPAETYLTIGNSNSDGNREQGLAGQLDSVRFFNQALTAQQISDEFRRIGPGAPSLVGDWQFNELDGPLAYDSTGNKSDGTLVAPYAGRRMRTTFTDRVTPGGLSGNYPITLKVTDGSGGSALQSFSLNVTADAPAALGGRVFNDQNGDQQSTGDPGLPNRPVYLDLDGNGALSPSEPTATTDANGYYSFKNLTPGTYTVAIVGQPGYRTTVPAGGSASINLLAGQTPFIDQYASSVIAVSSRSGTGGLQSAQALGAPNVARFGFDNNAWAPDPQNSANEFITLGYTTPVRASGVTVTESNGNGFVSRIDLIDINDIPHTVFAGLDPTLPNQIRNFRVEFPVTDYVVKAVKIFVDGTRNTQTHEQIDAVLLHGFDATNSVNFGETTLGVAAAQRGPTFTSTPLATAAANELYFYQTKVNNLDGRPLTFDVLVAPAGLAINAESGGLAWIPSTNQSGPNRVIIRVKDDRGLVDIQDFSIQVAAAPTAPIFTSIPLGAAAPNVPYRYQPRVQDAEGGPFAFALENSAPGMTIDPLTGLVSWSPTLVHADLEFPITITATDSTGLVGRQDFDLDVFGSLPNSAPDIISQPRKAAGLGRPYRYQVRAIDFNRDPIEFSLVNPPTGMTIDDDGVINWTPDELGDYLVTVLASDGRSGSDSQSFTASVTSQLTNSAPRFTTTPPQATVAGTLFTYDAKVADIDGDAVQFILDDAPAGMSLDPETGTLRWQTTESLRGDFSVTLRAIDPYGAEAIQSFAFTVASGNEPPTITSIPLTEVIVPSTYLYQVIANDPFGRQLNYSLAQAPPGMNIDNATGLITWFANSSHIGVTSITVVVKADDAGEATQTYDLVVTETGNLPPTIFSTAPATATVGQPYIYDIFATDPESTHLLRYELRTTPLPAGMLLDPNTGRLTWTPTAADIGTIQITVAALDPANAAAVQSFLLTVLPVNRVPTINSTAPTAPISGGATFRYTVAANDQDFDTLSFTLTQSPPGMSIDAFGRITWLTPPRTTQQGPLNVPVTVAVSDGRGGNLNHQFNIQVVPDTTAPKVTVVPASNLIYFPHSLTVRVTASDDVAIASISLRMGNQQIPLDANGTAVIPYPGTASSIQTLTATATDTSGNTATGTNSVRFFNGAEEPNYPDVSIASPADSGVVFGPTDVIGTVSGTNITDWRLLVRREDASEDTFVEINSGTSPVNNSSLGRFDPTLLENDAYILRLIASNASGFETFDDHRIGVSGELKLGNFQLAFTDLTIPVSGIPITVTRTYDTLRASKEGDFGFGWRLDFRNTDLRTGLPKTGLEDFGVYSAFRSGTKVYLTLPGGKREGYTFNPIIRTFPGFGNDLTTVTPRFTPDPGVTNTLSVKSGTFLLGEDGGIYSGSGQPYNPAAEEFGGGYTITTRDGDSFQIDGNTGLLTSAKDRNNNQLTFADTGVTSSAGKGLVFERDRAGRITAIVDPMNQKIRYAYDASGNLVSVTDRMQNRTTFRYLANPAHYLQEVIAPTDQSGIRTDFDAQGRLISITDPKGKKTLLNVNVIGLQNTITDRLGRITVNTFDERGNLLGFTNPLGETTSFTYDSNGNRITASDPLGNTFTSAYDFNGNRISSTDALGNTSRFTVDAFGQLLTTTDPLGNTQAAVYDNRGNVLGSTDSLGNNTAFTSDIAGNLLSRTDALGNQAFSTFDSAGNRTQLVGPGGDAIGFAFDANGNLLSQSPAVGDPWLMQYDANGQVTKMTLGGAAADITYDASGQPISAADPSGRSLQFDFDELGQLEDIVATGGVTLNTQSYDAEGNVIASTDPLGNTTHYEYDGADRLIKATFPGGATEFRSYDAAGRLVTATDPLGRITRFEYDANGQLLRTIDPLGGITRQHYNASGRLVAVTDPLLRVTQLVRDAAGRVIEVIDPAGNREQREYNAVGNVIRVVDRSGQATSYTYDAEGHLLTVTDPLGGITRYEYNAQGKPTSIIDANNRTTLLTYDSHDRLVGRTFPLGDTQAIGYDSINRITSTTNGNAQKIDYSYDNSGRLIQITFPGGAQESYTYTTDGLLSTVQDARGVTRYDYDPATRRLTSISQPDGRYLRYAYDAVGNHTLLASAMFSGGAEDITRYEYDALNRLAKIIDSTNGVTTYSYDAVGNLLTTAQPNGVTTTYAYNTTDIVTSVVHRNAGGTTLASFTYVVNSLGNRESITYADGSRVEYLYDSNSRITAERHFTAAGSFAGSILYTYDAVGNLIAQSGLLGAATFTYNANDQLISGDGKTYLYDGSGNLVRLTDAAGVTNYTYDSRGRMLSVQSPAGTTSYAYDFNGIRVSQNGPGGVINYLTDPLSRTGVPQIVRETNAAGATLRSHVWGLSLVSTRQDSTTTYFHSDGHGSIVLETDSLGVPTASYRYSAYGELLDETGTSTNAFLYAGQQLDAESGLYYMRARYYNPSAGRFISRDPAEGNVTRPLSLNKYLYADANPANRFDPTGETTLGDMLVTLKQIAEEKRDEIRNAYKAQEKVRMFQGKVGTYVGAASSLFAAFQVAADPSKAGPYFGFGAANILSRVSVGKVINYVAATAPIINILRNAINMFRFNTEYVPTVILNGEIFDASSDGYAFVLQKEARMLARQGKARVYLFPAYAFLPMLPTDTSTLTQMGAMVHEFCHISFDVEDAKIGTEEAYGRIALTLPYTTAITNPENIRLFVEDMAKGGARGAIDDFLS
jgi:RHS repeat-associated protein